MAKLLNAMVSFFTSRPDEAFEDALILESLGLTGNAGNLTLIDAPKGFTTEVKAAALLGASLDQAVKCAICDGYVDATKSVSYDHIIPKHAGGDGKLSNLSMVHPFCNSGVKGGSL